VGAVNARHKPAIALDTYGGIATAGAGVAPDRIVAAAAKVARQGVARVVLFGDGPLLHDRLASVSYDPMTLRVVDARVPHPRRSDDVFLQQEAAQRALPLAFEMLREGEIDALVTASPADTVFELARAHLPRLPGAQSLAAAAVFPCMPRHDGGEPLGLLLDVSGHRTQSGSELVEYALLGAAYARVVTGVAEPKVALLSTGHAAHDGPAEVVEAHARLKQVAGLRFVGNLTATEIARGKADVVVADGLLGHTVRGLLDGLTSMTVEAARYAWKQKVAWRMALRLLSQGVGMLRKVSEFQQYGGAPLLGLARLVLLAHPESEQAAFENAVRLATKCHGRDLQGELAKAVRHG
jgi:glycerol-3-phosphate acyltransferase PlsX